MTDLAAITTQTRWERTDLTNEEYNRPTQPPDICGLVYTGKRHALSGPPEASKTLVSLIFGLEHHRAGGTFALIDFEMGGHATRLLLNDLGATTKEIKAIYYVTDAGQPTLTDLQNLEEAGVTLAIIDAAAGAYAASDLDDNKRQDAETFSRLWVTPLWQRGITTILLDHVVKNTETRGKWTIGSERKLGAVDVHLGLEAVKQVHRGHTGLVKITTHKDRPAHLARPTAANLELQSDPDTHEITWEFKAPALVDEEHPFRPTVLMEKVSRYLEEHPGETSRNTIETEIKGKRDFVRIALDTLTQEGYIAETEGPKRGLHPTRNYEFKRVYKEVLDPQNQEFAPVRPEFAPANSEVSSPSSPPSPYVVGDANGELTTNENQAGSPQPDDLFTDANDEPLQEQTTTTLTDRLRALADKTHDPDADIPF